MRNQGDNNGISLKDVIDLAGFQHLADGFTHLTGMPTALLDLDGQILIASGWQKICTHFHRKNPVSASKCLESDTALANRLAGGETFNLYECKNGLIDVAVPILIENSHVGNLFAGQFFLKPPEIDFFSRQADYYGFDRKAYLEALSQVPVYSLDVVQKAMNFLAHLTTITGIIGLNNKKLMELNRTLEERVRQRTADLRTATRFSESLINSLPGVMYVFDQSGKFRRWNDNFEKVVGYSSAHIKTMKPLDFISPEDKDRVRDTMEKVFTEGSGDVEAGLVTSSGQVISYLFSGYHFMQNKVSYLVGVGIDISARTAVEKEKINLINKLQDSLAKVKKLGGLLPICASCKKIRNDEGYWMKIEAYIREHSEADFSHGICPDCAKKLYPGYFVGKRDPAR
ncbi:MAG: PocR ligand-binding domain-containing protein [Thermodesulfobacteriota bacterium]